MTFLQHLKLGVMFIAAPMSRRESFVESMRKHGQRAFSGDPDWVVGTIIHVLRTAHLDESRRLYAIALAEWADRQVARKLKAHVAAAAEALNKNEPGPAARP